MSEYNCLTRTIILDKVVFEKERRQAIEDLCSLASPDYTILYRSKEKSVENVCPVKGYAIEIIRYNPWSPSD